MKVLLASLVRIVRAPFMNLLVGGATTVNGGRRQAQPALDLHDMMVVVLADRCGNMVSLLSKSCAQAAASFFVS